MSCAPMTFAKPRKKDTDLRQSWAGPVPELNAQGASPRSAGGRVCLEVRSFRQYPEGTDFQFGIVSLARDRLRLGHGCGRHLVAGELIFEMIGAIAQKPNIESLLIQKPVSSPAQSTHASSAEAHRGSLSLEAAFFSSKVRAQDFLAKHYSSTFVPNSLQASRQTSARISVLST